MRRDTRFNRYSAAFVVLLGAGLGGCWVGSDEVADKVSHLPGDTGDTGDTDVWDELVITEVQPSVGVNKGGKTVKILVGPLDREEVPEVSFGGVPAEVLSHDVDAVEVRAPAVGVEGAVDVVVESHGRTARKSGGFFYWPDGAGRTGMLGLVANHDLDRGYDLSTEFPGLVPSSYTSDMKSAAVIYVEPVDVAWWEFYASRQDACFRDYRYDGPAINVLVPGVDRITLGGGGDQEVLGPDGNGEYYGFGLTDGFIAEARDLSLVQPMGDAGWVPFDISGAVRLPADGFRVTSPAADFAMPTEDVQFDLRWDGGGPGDVIIVEMWRFDVLGDLQDTVSCALVDDGQFTVPRSVWSNEFPFGGTVSFRVGKVRVKDATLPTNGAGIGVYGVSWWYGAFFVTF